ncbi:hypothetical protein ACLI4Z_11675 [Natrialbaceae archaeon A-arb3/5]
MVISNKSRDRAQVVLIGAIVIAFVILGVVVVFNGFLYTEEVSSSGTSQSTGQAEVTHDELTKSIQKMMAKEYNEDYQVTDDEGFQDNITEYVEEFNKLHSNTSSSSINTATVNVETDDSEPYEIARANDTYLGPDQGQGHYIAIDIQESISDEMYRFMYYSGGQEEEVTLEIHRDTGYEEVVIDQTGSDTTIDYNGNVCHSSTPNINFRDGTIDGEDDECVPSLLEFSDNIDELVLRGDSQDYDVRGYDIISEGIETGNSNHIRDVNEAVTYTDISVEYQSGDVYTNISTRVIGTEGLE